MAFGGVSLIVDGELCKSASSPVDAAADSGYHLLVVEGYSRTRDTIPNGDYIRSRPFLVGGHRWIVVYYPNGYEDDDDEFISVDLVSADDVGGGGQEGVSSQGVEAQFEFSFIDQPELQVSPIIRRSEKFVVTTEFQGYSKFVRKEFLERSRHLKNDSFVMRCDIVVVVTNNADNNTVDEHGSSGSTAPVLVQVQSHFDNLPASDMQSHFDNLLRSKEGADITFEVGGNEFAAHRVVLAARSAVFMAQLFGTMDEAGTTAPGFVKIDDIKADVFWGLLTFIYTDALALPWDDIEGNMAGDYGAEKEAAGETEVHKCTVWYLELLEAADRYDLQKLKSICEEVLSSFHICATSMADIIVVAERRGCRRLKEVCMEFIKSNTSLHMVFTADCLDHIIRTTSPSGLKELFSKFAAS